MEVVGIVAQRLVQLRYLGGGERVGSAFSFVAAHQRGPFRVFVLWGHLQGVRHTATPRPLFPDRGTAGTDEQVS